MATAEQLRLLAEAKKSLAKIQADDLSNISAEQQSSFAKQLGSSSQKIEKVLSPDQVTKAKISAAETQKSRLQSSLDSAKTKTPTPTAVVPPKQRVQNFALLGAGLQEAVNLGRQQRQSAELDFLGGVIPKGAVSAGTFTGLLSNLNRASTQYSNQLTGSVLEEASNINKQVQADQSSIRELALSAAQNGASQEIVNSILATNDVDNALSVAASSLNTKAKGGLVTEKVGSNLVTYDPNDPQGTMKVLFSSSGVSGSGSGGGTSTDFAGEVDTSGGIDFNKAKMADVKAQAKQVFSPDFANRVITELTDEELRLFLNDFTETQNTSFQSINPEQYFLQWKQAAGIEEDKKSSSKREV